MNKITPIVGTSKPDQVTKYLEKLILSKKVRPGEKLPSQQELAERFNVGIRSIREALKTLETRGLIDIQQGKGVFVKTDNLAFYLESLTDSLGFNFPCTKQMLLSLTQVRFIIETAIVKDLAVKADEGTLHTLHGLVDQMESSTGSPSSDIKGVQMLDMRFHMAIVEASGNPILVTLYNHLSRLLFSSMLSSGKFFPNIEKGFVEHMEILKAIEGHKVDRAVAIITEHLNNTRRILEAGLPDEDIPAEATAGE